MPTLTPRLETLESRQLLSHGSPGDVVLDWNDQALTAIRTLKSPPPIAARNLAIVHLAVFDAVNAIDGDYDAYLDPPVSGKQARHADPIAAAAAAAHEALVALYPTLASQFDAALATSLAGVKDGPREDAGVAIGKAVADQLLAVRATDHSTDTVTYTPGTGPAAWQPTAPAFAAALLPQWGGVTPFALNSGGQFRPPAPPGITSPAFATAFDQVKSLGSATSTTRTADQTQIALFWSDGGGTATPPGHWNVIAQAAAGARRTTRDLTDTARLFALLNAGLADAAIACWDSKYAFNFVRPITAIRNAAADGNALTSADPAWSPLIATPPFPSYVSGHSTFSGAAANILSSFFGTDRVRFTSTSDGLPGVTRSFTSFSAAADEAGMSRIYGGIHYAFDNARGLALGRQIAGVVNRSLLRPEHGRGHDGGPPFCAPPPVLAALKAVFAFRKLIDGRSDVAWATT